MKKYFISLSVIIVVFLIVWFGILPYLFEVLKPIFSETIEKSSGYSIVETNLKLKPGLFPIITINADNFEIRNPERISIVYANKPSIKISILPLCIGKIQIKKVLINDLNVNFYLDEKLLKNEKIVKIIKKSIYNSQSANILKHRLKLAASHNQEGLTITGANLYFSNKHKTKNIKLDAVITAQNKISTISANVFIPRNLNYNDTRTFIDIKNLDITPFSVFLDRYLPDNLKSFQGTVNLYADNGKVLFNFDNVKFLYDEEFKSIVFPQKLVGEGNFKVSEKDILFSSINIDSKDVKMQSNLRIKDFNSKQPQINLAAGVSNSKTETIIKMFPPLVTPDFNLLYLKKYPLYGKVNGSLNISGRIPEPDILGNILIEKGYLVNPVPNDKKQSEIKLSFSDKKVFYNVLAGAGGSENVKVTGNTKLYGDKYSKMHILSTSNVNLSTAKSVVDPLRKILYFETGPVPILNLTGFGNIDLKVEGNHSNPHAWGRMNFKNVSASFVDIPNLELKNASGFINFDNQDVKYETINAYINNKPAKLKGISNLYGKFSVDFSTSGFNLQKGLKAINTSPMLKDIKDIIPPLEKVSGVSNIKVQISGNLPDIENIIFNKNLFIKGELTLFNVSTTIKDLILSGINGKIKFDGTNMDIDTVSKINNSKINMTGTVKNNISDIKITSGNLNLADFFQNSPIKGLADNNFINFNCTYKGKTDAIEFDKINMTAELSKPAKTSPIIFTDGNITLKNGLCSVDNVKGLISQNPFNMSAKIRDFGRKNQNINANISLKNANLSTINLIREFYFIPNDTKELLRKFDFQTGKTDINLKIINNRPYTDFGLNDVTMIYLPLNMPLKILNGGISLKNNLVHLNKINTLADDMPIFVNGYISDIYKNPNLNVYINSVPKQTFIDKYINKNTLYPLRLRGDIIYSAKIRGIRDLYNISANAKIAEKASIYYLGASIGDNENQTIINFDSDIVKNNSIKINNFEYNKSVLSQNNRSNIINFLKIKGFMKFVGDEPYFNDLIIKTENPTDARIFNVIFKKPNIKQGLFTSDLKINGRLSDLKLLGDFHIFDINVPLLQTIVKDISLKFLKGNISIDSKGEIFSNEITLAANAENHLKPPYRLKNGIIHCKKLDLDSAIADLKKIEINKPRQDSTVGKQDVDLTALIIERLDLKADNVLLRGFSANNMKTAISLNEKMNFALNNYNIDLAGGSINGDFSYNLLSNKANLLINAEKIDANELSEILFDLTNQMYGSLTGTVHLGCNGTSNQTCKSTLYGAGTFNVTNGRMPKLGSLEYLLKAGNLLKGGITGLSINSLVDIITPLKTGEFSNIYGSIKITDGIADDIKITTLGKDLNLYIKGTYNIVSSDASMIVLGMLSKNIKTPLGAVGNMSLNTLFNLIPGINLEVDSPILNDINKIPGIELSKKTYRKFIAEIRGDINGDNYVKSFKWIN